MTGKPVPVVYLSEGHKAKRGLFAHAHEAQGDSTSAELRRDSYGPGRREAGALHLSITEHKPTAQPGSKTSPKVNPEPNALFVLQLFLTKCFSK